MLNFNPENKKLGITIDNQHLDKNQIAARRQNLLFKLARETDSTKLEDFTLELAQLNSAIEALTKVEQAQSETRQVRAEFKRAERTFAEREAEQFKMNCDMIAQAKIMRHDDGIADPYCGDDRERSVFKMHYNRYFPQIFQALGYLEAEKQVNEILTAAMEKRPWKEIVKLPKL